MLETLNAIDSFVWGPPLLVLLVGTGILLTFRLQLLQVFKLPQALGLIFSAKNDGSGDVNSFKALCTALAATVGTGNIVGVATAIKAGGPGALFWMWIAVHFSKRRMNGNGWMRHSALPFSAARGMPLRHFRAVGRIRRKQRIFWEGSWSACNGKAFCRRTFSVSAKSTWGSSCGSWIHRRSSALDSLRGRGWMQRQATF